jgi:hypothetical protein
MLILNKTRLKGGKNRMKKIILIILSLTLLTNLVFALANNNEQNSFKIDISQKNLDGESTGSAYGQVFGWNYDEIQVIALGLEDKTDYTLAYYEEKTKPIQIRPQGSSYSNSFQGSSYSSKRYPTVYCLIEGIKSSYGSISKSGEYKFSKLLTDKKNQKIILVPSSDINCKRHKFFKFKIEEYLSGNAI